MYFQSSRSFITFEAAFDGRLLDRRKRTIVDDLFYRSSCVLVDRTLAFSAVARMFFYREAHILSTLTSAALGHAFEAFFPLNHPKSTDRLDPRVKLSHLHLWSLICPLETCKIDLQTEHGIDHVGWPNFLIVSKVQTSTGRYIFECYCLLNYTE